MTDPPIELARHYREEADRVRDLAAQAVMPDVRDALLGVVQQYAGSGIGVVHEAVMRAMK